MKALNLPALPALILFAPLALAQAPAPDTPATAEPAPGAGGFLQSPDVSPSPVTGEAVEPDITIRDEGEELIYEYRVNGQLYMVKVQPQIGPPYYLLDTDGDGLMDVRDMAPRDNAVPQWVLFQWR